MEEFDEISAAYYHNATSEVQQLAWQFFRSMDKDNDGQVNFLEFIQFCRQRGYNVCYDDFAALDANGDGSLDFQEVLTLYYNHENPADLRQLQKDVTGSVFTCVTCFHSRANSCDLCATCYRERRFPRAHTHTSFLDSHTMLLRSKKRVPATPAMNNPQFQGPYIASNASSSNNDWRIAFNALDMTVNLLSSDSCSIM